MTTTTYIPHSLIIEIKPAVFKTIIIETKEGKYTTQNSFKTSSQGITGNFTLIDPPINIDLNNLQSEFNSNK